MSDHRGEVTHVRELADDHVGEVLPDVLRGGGEPGGQLGPLSPSVVTVLS